MKPHTPQRPRRAGAGLVSLGTLKGSASVARLAQKGKDSNE